MGIRVKNIHINQNKSCSMHVMQPPPSSKRNEKKMGKNKRKRATNPEIDTLPQTNPQRKTAMLPPPRKTTNSNPDAQSPKRARTSPAPKSTSKGTPSTTQAPPPPPPTKSTITTSTKTHNPKSHPRKPTDTTTNNTTTFLTSLLTPPPPSTHTLKTTSIISSTSITQKVTSTLQHLSSESETEKPALVLLYAKAPVAAKLLSVVEIVKRELAREGGRWFVYIVVRGWIGEVGKDDVKGSVKEDGKKNGKGKDGGDAGVSRVENGIEMEVDAEQEGEEDDEEHAFETMKTPFERAIDGVPKVRSIPVMGVYLSRIRVDSLKKAHGESTNAPVAGGK